MLCADWNGRRRGKPNLRLRKLGLPVVRWPGAYRAEPVVVAALRAGLFPFVASVGAVTAPAGARRVSYLLPGLFPTRLRSVDAAAETGGCMTWCDLACRAWCLDAALDGVALSRPTTSESTPAPIRIANSVLIASSVPFLRRCLDLIRHSTASMMLAGMFPAARRRDGQHCTRAHQLRPPVAPCAGHASVS